MPEDLTFVIDSQSAKGRGFMTNDMITHIDGISIGQDVAILKASPNPRILTISGIPTTHLKAMTYQERVTSNLEPHHRDPGEISVLHAHAHTCTHMLGTHLVAKCQGVVPRDRDLQKPMLVSSIIVLNYEQLVP